MENVCPHCGAPLDPGASECQYCGVKMARQAPAAPAAPVYAPPPQQRNPAINMAWPIKSKIVAGLLAIFLGSFGLHKFYLGKTAQGVVMLLFCWTYIPSIISFIEGIIILASKDENFQLKYQCRLQ